MCRVVLAISLLALLGVSLVGCATVPSALSHSDEAPLQVASQQRSGWSYRLGSLLHCQVADGIEVLKNDAVKPIRISRVTMVTSGGGAALANLHWSYQLMSFRRGATTGDLAGRFALTALGNGRSLGAAIGGTLSPAVLSGDWYDVIARLRLPPGHMSAWEIRGMAISYEVGSQSYVSRFTQRIRLPAASHCPRA
jgi:hypothetical protein